MYPHLVSASGLSILFDLDDTLVDSGGVKRRVFSSALKQCSIEENHLVEDFMRLSGIPLFELCDDLGLPREVPSLYRKLSAEVRSEIVAFPGVLNMLCSLAERNISMGIVTGRDRESSLQILEINNLTRYFQALVTPDDINCAKPLPGPLYYACGLLKSAPKGSVFVGDSIVDMKSAKAAGMVGIGSAWSGNASRYLLQAGASSVVHKVKELEDTLLNLFNERQQA